MIDIEQQDFEQELDPYLLQRVKSALHIYRTINFAVIGLCLLALASIGWMFFVLRSWGEASMGVVLGPVAISVGLVILGMIATVFASIVLSARRAEAGISASEWAKAWGKARLRAKNNR
jgi:hypothetical protein